MENNKKKKASNSSTKLRKIQVRMPEDLYNQIENKCRRNGQTKTAVTMLLLLKWLKGSIRVGEIEEDGVEGQ